MARAVNSRWREAMTSTATSAERDHLACCASLELAETVAERLPTARPAALPSRRFEILRCLGHGGMGVVHEAFDRVRGGRVALKRLRHPLPELVGRFKREFHSL